MTRPKKLVAMTALLFAGCCAAVYVSSAQERGVSGAPAGPAGERGAALFSQHRKWMLVNPARARMDAATAALCRAPTPAETGRGSLGPHQGKFISVYVNEVGAKAMKG